LDICCISPKWLFFISPSQSSQAHLHVPQSTHQRGAVVPALQLQPAISAAEKSTMAFWPKTKLRFTTDQAAQHPTAMKKPRCVATAGFQVSTIS
jgi:hypothetical protein